MAVAKPETHIVGGCIATLNAVLSWPTVAANATAHVAWCLGLGCYPGHQSCRPTDELQLSTIA